ncbi:MAG: hypothetical protein GKR90_22630 [Pseudomonadales bacterium]|nr:hypothetical protein [Pseudomonadales bacterium]
MNWDAIGAVGEILGAITVVATLFYLSRQIRQNSASLDRANDYAQASSIHESNALYAQVHSVIVQDSQMAAIYQKALDGAELDDVEATRFATFIKTYLVWAEDLFHQQEVQLGFAMVGDTEDLLRTIGPYIRKLMDTRAGKHWWKTDAQYHFSPAFYKILVQIVETDTWVVETTGTNSN